ncbi:GNAT family N-acetyltransferase [Halobacillus amylolyticus]|uniref:GNAT family N-acetyltransferase n=1 Tax=Halobacillus amylolyticus TaxID=2932259 RepID=A0ABY4HD92_9BACI|nr:GNAT family N-acetyltransferase [Halobacillus amylolyticus]UOR12866.1 GNAT family N-acetyltransferase [Halobacillus amylolyticus]
MRKIKSKEISLERLYKNDIPCIIALSQSIGWDYDYREISTVMSAGKVFGHKRNDHVVSCGALITYDTELASIGMIIVDQNHRGLGLGRQVTQVCVNNSTGINPVMLIATPEGKFLYERMGFKIVDHVHKLLVDNYKKLAVTQENHKVDRLRKNEITKVIQLDQGAFGDSRSRFLRERINQSHECLILKDQKNEMIGYGLSVLGPVNLILGPIVAPSSKAASLLINELSKNHNGKLRIDVPSGQDDFLHFLKAAGFDQVSQPPIMMLNAESIPKRNNHLYGIAAQVFG